MCPGSSQAWSATHPSLPLPHRAASFVGSPDPSLSDLRAKLYRRTGLAPLLSPQSRGSPPGPGARSFCKRRSYRAAVGARAAACRCVVTLHGADVTVRGSQPDRYKRLGEEASLFLCVSKFIRDRALEAGFPSQKLLVHCIGIDRDLFSPSPEPEVSQDVLFVGRLVEKKGCEYLLRAMRLVQQAHPQCELIIIGDGPLRPSLEALATELKLRCQFRGAQPAARVRESLRRARIACAPSVTAADGNSEGLPTVVGEALAMGVPVVATRHAGIPEIVIPHVTGLLRQSVTQRRWRMPCVFFLLITTYGSGFTARLPGTLNNISIYSRRQCCWRTYIRARSLRNNAQVPAEKPQALDTV